MAKKLGLGKKKKQKENVTFDTSNGSLSIDKVVKLIGPKVIEFAGKSITGDEPDK